MSTRAQIRIEGSPCLIYKHSDGYPEGVVATLASFVAKFWNGRGYDPEYCVARCLAAFIAEDERANRAYAAKLRREGQRDLARRIAAPSFLGYGVSTDVHGDIEYLYTVRRDGTIEVRSRAARNAIEAHYDSSNPTDWPVIQTLRLGGPAGMRRFMAEHPLNAKGAR